MAQAKKIDSRLKGLKERIRLGCKWRQAKGESDKWERWRNWTRGKFGPRYLATENIFYKNLSVMRPTLYFQQPNITVTAQTPGDEGKAVIAERLSSILIDELDFWSTIRLMITEAFHCGTSFAKTGLFSEYQLNPGILDKEELFPEDLRNNSGEMVGDQLIEPGWPWWDFTASDQIILPWGCKKVDEAEWFAHLILISKAAALRDWRFNRKDIEALTPTGLPLNQDGQQCPSRWKELLQNNDDAYFLFYEVHDRIRKEVFIVDAACEVFLMKPMPDEMQLLDMLPLDALCFNWDTESVWGGPDGQLLDGLQVEANIYRDSFARQAKASVTKKMIPKGRMTEDERKKLNSDNPSPSIIEGNVQQGEIVDLSFQFPTEMAAALNWVDKDCGEYFGYSSNASGEFAQGRKTASEVMAVREGRGIKVEERRDIIGRLICRSADRLLEVVKQFWSVPKAINIAGPGSEPFWMDIDGESVPLKRKIKVEAESTQPMDRTIRKQEAMQIFGALRGDPMINQAKLYEVTGRQFSWLDIASLMAPQGMGGAPGSAMPGGAMDAQLQAAMQRVRQGGGQVSPDVGAQFPAVR